MLSEDDKYTHAWRQVEVGQSGRPPYFNQRKDLILLLDGELFYQDELRKKLQKGGETQEELILEAYEIWGEKFLTHLDGDFALALVDKKNSKLILARDRVGKKPLYWADKGGYFLFGSELKGFLASGIIPQTPSSEALATYLAFGYCPQDATLIQNVNRLLPAHILVLDHFKKLRIESYWSLSSFFDPSTSLDRHETAQKLEYLLKQAVKERTRNKKEVGCFLSGGLGSASVGWFLKQNEQQLPVSTFSTFFKGQNEEDYQAAELFSEELGANIRADTIDPAHWLSSLSDILWKIEEPIADPHLTALWQLTKMPSHGMAIFSGMGSDELLAGHSRYTLEQRELGPIENFMGNLSLKIKKGLIPLYHFFGSNKAYDYLRSVRQSPYLTQYVHQNLLFQKKMLTKISPTLAPLFDPIVFLEKFHNLNKLPNAVSAFIYLDLKTALPDFYSRPFERLTFESKLQWETPFLDRRLIEFAAEIPEEEDLTEFETGAYLKAIMRPHFSQKLVERPKRLRRGFLSSWVNDPHILPHFLDLKNGVLVERGYIDKKWVETVLSTPQLRMRHFRQLFALLVLKTWFHLFILKPVVQK